MSPFDTDRREEKYLWQKKQGIGNQTQKAQPPRVFNIPLEPPAPTVAETSIPAFPALMLQDQRSASGSVPHLCPGWSHPLTSPAFQKVCCPLCSCSPHPEAPLDSENPVAGAQGPMLTRHHCHLTNWAVSSSAKWEVVSVVTRKLHLARDCAHNKRLYR